MATRASSVMSSLSELKNESVTAPSLEAPSLELPLALATEAATDLTLALETTGAGGLGLAASLESGATVARTCLDLLPTPANVRVPLNAGGTATLDESLAVRADAPRAGDAAETGCTLPAVGTNADVDIVPLGRRGPHEEVRARRAVRTRSLRIRRRKRSGYLRKGGGGGRDEVSLSAKQMPHLCQMAVWRARTWEVLRNHSRLG
mmetsp:Transcript_16969/g.53902  ORF Transcript_16969/g.53902 Transcript_16969/m.53902 type:complete len:205 (+) Transcript_16969:2302-2916(+)